MCAQPLTLTSTHQLNQWFFYVQVVAAVATECFLQRISLYWTSRQARAHTHTSHTCAGQSDGTYVVFDFDIWRLSPLPLHNYNGRIMCFSISVDLAKASISPCTRQAQCQRCNLGIELENWKCPFLVKFNIKMRYFLTASLAFNLYELSCNRFNYDINRFSILSFTNSHQSKSFPFEVGKMCGEKKMMTSHVG